MSRTITMNENSCGECVFARNACHAINKNLCKSNKDAGTTHEKVDVYRRGKSLISKNG